MGHIPHGGGILSIAYVMASTVFSDSAYYESGNTRFIRRDVKRIYRKYNKKSHIFLVEHSAGGGDVQNLLWKLILGQDNLSGIKNRLMLLCNYEKQVYNPFPNF